MKKTRTQIEVSKLQLNTGQMQWLPKNPRQWTQTDLDRTKQSITEDEDFLEDRPVLVVPNGKKYCVFAGNLRTTALQELKAKTTPAVVYEPETEEDRLTIIRRAMKDNGSFGSWDFNTLANEWDSLPLTDWGVPAWETKVMGEGEKPQSGFSTDGWDECNTKLADRFIVPPFSILDATSALWMQRRERWLQITGDLSETRDGEFGTLGNNRDGGGILATINGGTSNFDPVLAEIVFKWFCPEHGKVLDPFGGEQTKGVVAGEMGLRYNAVEFRPEQVELNKEKTAKYGNVKYYCGDSNDIDKIISERDFDLCFTSPPYYDLEVYSEEDMSALGTYDDFMAQYENIFRHCYDMLATDAFLVVKVGEIRDKKGNMRGFVSDNIDIMKRIGFNFYNEIILEQSIGTAPLRANQSMRNRKVIKRHQNVLVFLKGEISRLLKRMPSLDFATVQEQVDGVETGEQEDAGANITIEGAGVFFQQMQSIYNKFSRQAIPTNFNTLPAGMLKFIDHATIGSAVVQHTKEDVKVRVIPNKRVVLAFTGGKDSISYAIRLAKKGYEPTLLFIKGLNKAYPAELEGAKESAGVLGMPIVVVGAHITGKNMHPDNPVKNQAILAYLADYAISHDIANIAMGVVAVDDGNYDYDWSDSRKLMDSYVGYLQACAEGLHYVDATDGVEADNIVELLKHPNGKRLWQLRTSCVGTHRFRASWRRGNEKKYGIKLEQNECGSCFKCAYAYIVRVAVEGNANVEYLRKCFEIVISKGEIYHTNTGASNEDVLRNHFGERLADKVIELYHGLRNK